MMTRVKLGMAVALGLGLSLGGFASAATINNSVQDAVASLNSALDIVIGSSDDQAGEDCPGGSAEGTEDIYDFGQDGIPDYAQMALLEALYNMNSSLVRPGLTEMATGLKDRVIVVPAGSLGAAGCTDGQEGCVCLLGLCGPTLVGLINGFEYTTPELLNFAIPIIDSSIVDGLTQAEIDLLIDQAIDSLIYWGAIDNPANFNAATCIDEIVGVVVGILTTLYNTNQANMNGVVGGQVVLSDGDTILDKWLEAVGGKTLATDDAAFLATVNTFVGLVLATGLGQPQPGDDPMGPFPSAPPGSPVGAPVGLALLAAGLGFAAYRRSRRS
jgi:hypothetical protein